MKRQAVNVLTVVIIAVILLTGGILEEIYIANTLDGFAEKFVEFEKTETESGYDIGKLEEIYSWWETRHKALEMLIPHTQINEIESTFGELKGAVRANDTKSAHAFIVRLQLTVEAMADMYVLRIGNVL
ncbi:MAG: DUF4363 family protein [Christensenellaceae bacterium]|jgi:hypothetical protein|nr:DUF4363 family protein [Christensenellaceae bacterium]